MTFARVVFWLAIAVWVGAVVFLSFIVAPTVFTALPREEAGRVMGLIFPHYYALQMAAGLNAAVAAVVLSRRTPRPWRTVAILVALMLGGATYAGRVIQPETQALRIAIHSAASTPEMEARFDTLHRRAVRLNGIILLLGVGCIAVAAGGERQRDATRI